ncbi:MULTISPECIES: efflux RND transporter periplasmic adaptor subunit [unclassified Treponema]|uniref:efflux RND transporter periplasmic adaptor subunit n=1 Tax=unclassified Treponema TaxID=2638727 RepID=UPI0025EB79AF|nr:MULTISPECIES: efflux RND transporter periplasmic adaptor subunit [unclassified Treponema]
MKIRKSFIVAAVAVLAVVLTAVYAKTIGKSSGKPAGFDGRGGRGGNSAVVSVRTMTAEITTLHGYVNTNGEVESQNSVSVYPDMGGKVISTSVMLGSSVKKNDIIAYVDPSEPGTNYRSSPVYAPISGSVISTPLKNGKKVTTSTAIAIIGDINNLQVTANVPERYVAVLKKGLKAEVSVEAYPGVIFAATVSRVSPVVDATTRTKEVILTFDRHDERINAGMFAKVKLYTEDYSGAVVMPSDALVQNGDDFFAYIVNSSGGGETVSKVKVEKGKTVDGYVQILSGVKEGDKVVIQGMASLGDGSKILDISSPTKKN